MLVSEYTRNFGYLIPSKDVMQTMKKCYLNISGQPPSLDL